VFRGGRIRFRQPIDLKAGSREDFGELAYGGIVVFLYMGWKVVPRNEVRTELLFFIFGFAVPPASLEAFGVPSVQTLCDGWNLSFSGSGEW
jgi:hypothetical protein